MNSGFIPRGEHFDVTVVGGGAAGLFFALHMPRSARVLMIMKGEEEESDSFLAQGGICVLRSSDDYPAYFEDTLRAGHYENDRVSVAAMILSSPHIIRELEAFGADFAKEDGRHLYTREGAHSKPRILYHMDTTGAEITRNLLTAVRSLPNVTILTGTRMLDLITDGHSCYGVVILGPRGELLPIFTRDTILACGGVGGVYERSTNYRLLTGDGVAAAARHGAELRDVDYVQIHPTTLLSKKPGRSFLISESVRGEGAVLLDKDKLRFANELLPRDLLTAEIHKQMEKDGTDHVWLNMATCRCGDIKARFPTIAERCADEGIDILHDLIPVVPAQHYFMGGVKVDLASKTTIDHLYAAGETACNGVHGANRLASNSLLETLVFAERAADDVTLHIHERTGGAPVGLFEPGKYNDTDKWQSDSVELVKQLIAQSAERRKNNGSGD